MRGCPSLRHKRTTDVAKHRRVPPQLFGRTTRLAQRTGRVASLLRGAGLFGTNGGAGGTIRLLRGFFPTVRGFRARIQGCSGAVDSLGSSGMSLGERARSLDERMGRTASDDVQGGVSSIELETSCRGLRGLVGHVPPRVLRLTGQKRLARSSHRQWGCFGISERRGYPLFV